MEGLAVEATASARKGAVSYWVEYLVIAAFVVLTAITVRLHEPWSDEANSWLLGRDAGLVELWTHLMHYEGTPALWQTILHLLIRLGLPYAGLNYFSGALGCVAAWLVIRLAPWPPVIRLATPFTFYLFYQYSVIARSYCLLPLLLFLCAWIYPRAMERMGWTTVLLCAMAAVSVHGMILSGAIGICLLWDVAGRWGGMDGGQRRKVVALTAVYCVAAILMARSAWPAPDVFFAHDRDYSFDHLLDTTGETLGNAFTGEWISSLVVVLACVPFLWRGRGLLMFSLSAVGLCLFNAWVYTNVWHQGMLFLAWLFALWISGEAAKPRWMNLLGMAGILAVIGVQGYWAFATATYDWRSPYSGSREAAGYLKEKGIVEAGVYGYGFAALGVQPYFAHNIFPNFRGGGTACYFDWSEAFRNFEEWDDLAKTQPEYVLVGYKDDDEKAEGEDSARKAGYRMIRHFEGNLFWHTGVLEPDALDLYQRIR